MSTFLWGVLPYLCVASLVGGTIWRYRYDKFGWTTRSSQLYENRLLRIGSPLFHFGVLGVVGGHVIGLLVPQSWTDALGISHRFGAGRFAQRGAHARRRRPDAEAA